MDHIGSNLQWKALRPDVQIVCGTLKDKIPGATLSMQDLSTMTIGDITLACLTTPGHLEEHVSFVVTHVTPTSTKIPFLFCGDTLFIGGCG